MSKTRERGGTVMTWPLSGIVVFAACVILVMLLTVGIWYLERDQHWRE